MKLKGSKTEVNLRNAFIGEAMARCRYMYYAEKAREEGREDVAAIYEKFARNEQEHAKIWFKNFHGILSTEENLKESIINENYESIDMYLSYAKTAQEEGFDDLAMAFMNVARIEDGHKKQFQSLLRDTKVDIPNWQCDICGYIDSENENPPICPVCKHRIKNQ
ncbi:rubrerythrin family protein [Brachyspira hampsonii]|uniref:Rubrerythrin n=1 Tax=Brachyspira hampsonii TaxID=1287055 RepID=A0AAC9TUE6_9SPIR|nr:ferritin family protein [Brachyspira hampsonii]ASJ21698.1 rubrerythrin [Brachyspira hampsonii]ELV06683.1 rubrerythrin [Brachyspira hampsonii 30599]MBW5380358.1 rubrerythrin [Brachyspira hampsonii]MBW5410707.1 rubrerythrin [Brachyspira hampsonii]OEJ18847.1 rubrerythrin [Brachyspira hampsonii]